MTEQQAQGGLFKHKPAEGSDPGRIASEMSNLSRRLRVLEERFTNLRNQAQVNDQNMLASNKKVNAEITDMKGEMNGVRKSMSEIRDTVNIIIKELKECAKKEDVAVLEKYINFWQPVNFVTRSEAERMIKEATEK
ncbi:MAG: hypothetical protein ABH879_10690 [archaeon]